MKIDTTKTPSLAFEGAIIESHDKSLGKIDPSKLELYLSPNQEEGGYIEGHKLLKELKDKPVLNATVLDYLWEHQDQIPKSWKEKTTNGKIQYIFFWGTIYRDSDGGFCVRYLFFGGGTWVRDYDWLNRHWGDDAPAVLLASSPKSLKSLKSLESLDSLSLEKRVEKMENWIDKWETYDSGWRK